MLKCFFLLNFVDNAIVKIIPRHEIDENFNRYPFLHRLSYIFTQIWIFKVQNLCCVYRGFLTLNSYQFNSSYQVGFIF